MRRFIIISAISAGLVVPPAAADVTSSEAQQAIYSARDKVLPALVHIQPVIKNYRTGEMEKQAVIGSGMIFHRDGYVVTNYHVAGKAERIICTLSDKERLPAEYVGGDPLTDIAVIKLDLTNHTEPLPIAEFGNSDSIEVGQYVLAMGSPLSLSRSVSSGVISTKDRYFSPNVRLPSGERTGRYNLWIQTDAAINPGNSGGPLVDMSGRVIGINSRATFLANNLGFAIPINVVREVTAAILDHGEVERSWIGLHCQPLQELEEYFNTDGGGGVLISSIDPGSPAEQAFLKAGDVILQVDDNTVSARFFEELPEFYSLIATHPPGSQVQLRVLREEQEYSFAVITKPLGSLQGEDFDCEEWGFTVKAITEQMLVENRLTTDHGVYVVGVKQVGAAGTGGLRRNDVVTKINDTELTNLSDFIPFYEKLSVGGKDNVLLTVRRGNGIRYVLLNTEGNPAEADNDK